MKPPWLLKPEPWSELLKPELWSETAGGARTGRGGGQGGGKVEEEAWLYPPLKLLLLLLKLLLVIPAWQVHFQQFWGDVLLFGLVAGGGRELVAVEGGA